MDHESIMTEHRPVGGFDRVSLRGNACSTSLLILQGEKEGLTIEAPPGYLHRLSSEVTDRRLLLRLGGTWLQELEDAINSRYERPPIRCRLLVHQLTGLEIQCASLVCVPSLKTQNLQVKMNGAGDLRFGRLDAGSLEIEHNGTGTVRICGMVDQQAVRLNGMGDYLADDLVSSQAIVRIQGAGMARVRVDQALDAGIRGMGVLEYTGNPKLKKQIAGLGQVRHFEENQEAVS